MQAIGIINRQTGIKRYWFPIIFGGLIGILLSLVITVTITQGWAGLGGFASELRIDRSGVANSSVVISRDGAGAPVITGMGPIVSTGEVITMTPAYVIVSGTLDDLNGFPNAGIWFEYWQTGAPSTTAEQTVTALGVYTGTLDVSWIDPALPIYFRIVGNADGSNYGATQSFYGTGTGETAGKNIISIVLLIGIITACIVGMVVNFRSPKIMALILVTCVIAYLLATYIIDTLW